MKNYFRSDEFYKEKFSSSVDADIRKKIQHHIDLLNPVRRALGAAITISHKSGFRPKSYELSRGRSGRSQHCFIGEGAVDLTCRKDSFNELYELLKDSGYTRICLYPNNMFIHCDLVGDELVMFMDFGKGGGWERS